MTWGQAAALIAAIAFAVLVIYLVKLLRETANTMAQLTDTARELNTTIAVLRKDVDELLVEVNSLMGKTNDLVADVNQKLEKTDPLFQALGDVGDSVSDVNASARGLIVNLLNKKQDNKDADDDKDTEAEQESSEAAKAKPVVRNKVQTAKKSVVQANKNLQKKKIKKQSETKAF